MSRGAVIKCLRTPRRSSSASAAHEDAMKHTKIFLMLLVVLIVGAWRHAAVAADRLVGVHSAQVLSQSMPWIAQEAGLFKKYDLDFHLVFITSSPVATAAALGGDAEVQVTGAVGHGRPYLPGSRGLLVDGGFKTSLTDSSLAKADSRRQDDLTGKPMGVAGHVADRACD